MITSQDVDNSVNTRLKLKKTVKRSYLLVRSLEFLNNIFIIFMIFNTKIKV